MMFVDDFRSKNYNLRPICDPPGCGWWLIDRQPELVVALQVTGFFILYAYSRTDVPVAGDACCVARTQPELSVSDRG